MSSLKQQKENLEKQIKDLQLKLETINNELKRATPRRGDIVFSREWEDGTQYEIVHIIPETGDTTPVITEEGQVEYDFVEEPSLIPSQYRDFTVLTEKQVKEVFEFIKEIANR